MKYGFGIDLGGTTVKIAFFDQEGAMLAKWEIPTVTENGGKQILPDIAASIQEKMKEKGIAKKIGISFHDNAELLEQFLDKYADIGNLFITKTDDTLEIFTIDKNNFKDESVWKGNQEELLNDVFIFDYIEDLVERENVFTMEEFAASVNEFLSFRKYQILKDKGSVSRIQAERKAGKEYDQFNKTQKIESDFDKVVKKLK